MRAQRQGEVIVYGTVDGGWAWAVLIALTFWNALIAGTLKSFGVIYLEFLELYDRGPVATAWLGFSFSFLTTLLAPVSGYIGDQVSLQTQRVLVMALSILTTVAIAVTGSMPTLEGAIVTYGIAGITAAVVDTPILSLIGKYFRKRRFTASGIMFAGSSLGTLVFPPFITYLVNLYTIKGTMIVLGAIWLNSFVVGAVIRPIKPTADLQEADDIQTIPAKNNTDENTNEVTIMLNDNYLQNENKQRNTQISPNQYTKSLDTYPGGLSTFLGSSSLSLDRQFMEQEHKTIQSSKSTPSSPQLKVAHDRQMCNSIDDVTNKEHMNNDVTKVVVSHERSYSHSGLSSNCQSKVLSLGKKLLLIVKGYWEFLKTPGLPLLIVTFCTASFAYFNQFFLLPPLGQEVGMSKIQGALLVSISNVTELVFRLIAGVLIDRKLIQKSLMMKVNFVVAAVTCFTMTFFPDQTVLYVYSGVFGMVGGMFLPLSIPLMIQLVKESQISSATGIFVLVTGTGISLGPPILGAIKELSGSYVDSFRVCSIFYVIALVAYLFQNGDLPGCRKGKCANQKQEPAADLEQEIA